MKASAALDQEADYLLMDIGGGSVEFIHSQKAEAVWKISLEIGMARLNELFPLNDPPEAAMLDAATAWLRERLDPLFSYLQNQKQMTLCGSAGSFDTLIALQHKGTQYEMVSELSKADFSYWRENLWQMPRKTRAALPGMKPIRVDMLVYALLLIGLVNDALGGGAIRTSSWSLREGALLELLGGCDS